MGTLRPQARRPALNDVLTTLVTFQAKGDDSGATEFLSALPDGALKRKAGEALGEMIARGTPDHAEFAAAQAGYVGHATPMADLLVGMQRPELSGNARAVIPIASEIARQVFGKLAPYDVEQVLGGDDGDASIGLRGALAQLDAAGQAKLAADVRARYSRLPAANQKSLEEDLKDANL